MSRQIVITTLVVLVLAAGGAWVTRQALGSGVPSIEDVETALDQQHEAIASAMARLEIPFVPITTHIAPTGDGILAKSTYYFREHLESAHTDSAPIRAEHLVGGTRFRPNVSSRYFAGATDQPFAVSEARNGQMTFTIFEYKDPQGELSIHPTSIIINEARKGWDVDLVQGGFTLRDDNGGMVRAGSVRGTVRMRESRYASFPQADWNLQLRDLHVMNGDEYFKVERARFSMGDKHYVGTMNSTVQLAFDGVVVPEAVRAAGFDVTGATLAMDLENMPLSLVHWAIATGGADDINVGDGILETLGTWDHEFTISSRLSVDASEAHEVSVVLGLQPPSAQQEALLTDPYYRDAALMQWLQQSLRARLQFSLPVPEALAGFNLAPMEDMGLLRREAGGRISTNLQYQQGALQGLHGDLDLDGLLLDVMMLFQ